MKRWTGAFTIIVASRIQLTEFLQAKLGVDHGPIHIVEAGLIDQLKELGWNVEFDGHHQFEEIAAENDPPVGKLKNPRLVSRVCESVAKAVGGHAKKGQLPLTLGGDHSLVSLCYPSSSLTGVDRTFVGNGYHLWISGVSTKDIYRAHGSTLKITPLELTQTRALYGSMHTQTSTRQRLPILVRLHRKSSL